MLAHDGCSQASSEELVHALAVPLASAENYLAGVHVHARSLVRAPHVSDELGALLSTGIHGAITHLERAAAAISGNGKGLDAHEPSQVPAGAAGKYHDVPHTNCPRPTTAKESTDA